MTTIEKDKEYIANTYARAPFCAVSGKGALVIGDDGKEYIDLGSGIAVNTFGFCDEEWIKAVETQLRSLQHISNLYYTKPQAALAEMLCSRTGMKKVFFSNSGAEANECAIKSARKYSSDKYGGDRHTIISLQNSFHGRTLATLTATGQAAMHGDFGPLLPGFKYAPSNDFEALKALCGESVCAVMLELIQGEGGVSPLDKEYVSLVSALCAEKDILLIIDEVQTGNGRTGSLFAFMQYGVLPDILSTAKGLAGGLPFGACLLGEKLSHTLTPGSHGSTFGGNPVAAAGAVNIISRIDEALLESVRAKGSHMRNALEGFHGVKSVTGMGLMLGIETERDAKEIAADCLDRGLIVLTAKNKIRLLPPLNISQELINKALEILKGAIEK